MLNLLNMMQIKIKIKSENIQLEGVKNQPTMMPIPRIKPIQSITLTFILCFLFNTFLNHLILSMYTN
jgi:hypothetical protein